MKTTRLLAATLLAASAALGGCDDDDDPTGTGATATVRFVNTTSSNIDVGTNGSFATANSNVAFGGGTSCMTVSPSSSTLSFRQNGQTATFTPAGFNLSAFTANVVTDNFTGASGTQGAVRVINARTGSTQYNLFVGSAGSMPTTANSTTFASGTASAFIPVNAGQGQVWLTTGSGTNQTTAFTSPAFAVAANSYQAMVIADPASGGSALRSFMVSACR